MLQARIAAHAWSAATAGQDSTKTRSPGHSWKAASAICPPEANRVLIAA